MNFVVHWSDDVRKQLENLEKSIAERIVDKVESIKDNPFHYVRKLKEYDFYRLRVGDYRVIMSIDNWKLIILVIEVGHRKNIYKKY
jgi:mRNA interferase RelE/StbE